MENNLILNDDISEDIMSTTTINKDEIKDFLKKILNSIFNVSAKQSIKDYPDRLNIACPYCLDSDKKMNEKRGNLYLKTTSYHCFNCGIHRSLSSFITDFNKILKLDPVNILKYRTSSFYVKNNKKINIYEDNIINKYFIDKSDLYDFYNLVDVQHTQAEKYLRKRCQYNNDNFAYSKKDDSIVIFNKIGDKVISFLKRNINNKQYILYDLKRLNSDFNNSTEDIDDVNFISNYFNFFNIDLDEIVTIFEGPMDSFLFYNSIALSGVNKQFNFDIEMKRFWLDNDTTGKRKSIALLREGESVFLWKKYLNEHSQREDIKDLNELVCGYKKNKVKYNPYDFNKYFSDNDLDIVNL